MNTKRKKPLTTSVSIRLKPEDMLLLREAAGAQRIDLYATEVVRRHLTNRLVDDALEATQAPPPPVLPPQSEWNAVFNVERKPVEATGLTFEFEDWLANNLHNADANALWRLLEGFRNGESMPRGRV